MNSTELPAQWDIWEPSLSTSVLRLRNLMRTDDAVLHPKDRPGLLVYVKGNDVCFFFSKGFKRKTLMCDSLTADAQLTLEVQDGESLVVYPLRTWNDQSNELRNNAKRILPNIIHVLNKTVAAVEKGTHLGRWLMGNLFDSGVAPLGKIQSLVLALLGTDLGNSRHAGGRFVGERFNRPLERYRSMAIGSTEPTHARQHTENVGDANVG